MQKLIQTELHRHLDISTRLSTVLELAQNQGLEAQSTSLEEFRKKFVLHRPLSSLNEAIDRFVLFSKIITSPALLERIVYEVIEDGRNEGLLTMELRYSPSFITEHNSFSWDESLQYILAGVKKAQASFPEMKVGLICIATREFGAESVDETVEFFIKHQQHFIGFDLAGKETEAPAKTFENSFNKIKDKNITIHAGEASGPESVWGALLLGAKRIGHGIRSIEDPLLIEHLIKNQICLEVCPISNWLTQSVKTLKDHPLPQLLRKGVMTSLNTDDPTIFGTTLEREIKVCQNEMGMTDSEIATLESYARKASFLR